MKLKDVQTIRLQIAQALFDIFPKILFRITLISHIVWAGRPVVRQGRGFGGDPDLFLTVLEYLSDQPFTFAVAITRSGVNEVYAKVKRPVESAAIDSCSS